MRRRKRNPDKKQKQKTSTVERLQEQWKAIVQRHTYAPFAGKWPTASRHSPSAPPVAPPARRPAAYVPTQPSASRTRLARQAKALFIAEHGQEAWDKREAAAREVKHTVMPGHKQGYQLVTDPELMKLMGKKP